MTNGLPFDLTGRRVFVAGHRGMAGSAIVRRLAAVNVEVITAERASLDLRRQMDVEAWMAAQKPDTVVVAAAKVGGIRANAECPVDFLADNLAIEMNLINASFQNRVDKLLFLGSTCVYPRLAAQPISEDELMSGPLEPTNEWYAIAKIAGIKLCQAYRRQYGADYISVMPTNLYGPGDNYDTESSHVAAALIRRFVEARRSGVEEVVVWGTGEPRREFLHVDDLADACIFLLRNYSDEKPINIGVGMDVTVRELAEMIAELVGYRGRIRFDMTQADGTPRKLVDVRRLSRLGWRPKIDLRSGLKRTLDDFRAGWEVPPGAKPADLSPQPAH